MQKFEQRSFLYFCAEISSCIEHYCYFNKESYVSNQRNKNKPITVWIKSIILGSISLGRAVVCIIPKSRYKPLQMKSYGVKEKHIGSSVSEILRTTQTDRHTHKDRHPVTFIEGYCLLFIVLCFQLIISQITISLHSRLMIIYTIQFFL